jgi:hypothetical protein
MALCDFLSQNRIACAPGTFTYRDLPSPASQFAKLSRGIGI